MTDLPKTLRNWRREHFFLFIYVHVALADNEMMYHEWDILKEKMSKISPKDEFSVLFVDVTKLYQRLTAEEIMEVIIFYKDNFQPTNEDIDGIVKNVQDIALADETVRQEELDIALNIRQILST